jgi:hypothetical protein
VSKFKIGQSVRLRSSVQAGRGVGGEYRIVRQLPQTDSINAAQATAAPTFLDFGKRHTPLEPWVEGSHRQVVGKEQS